jgi:hypothetical protein
MQWSATESANVGMDDYMSNAQSRAMNRRGAQAGGGAVGKAVAPPALPWRAQPCRRRRRPPPSASGGTLDAGRDLIDVMGDEFTDLRVYLEDTEVLLEQSRGGAECGSSNRAVDRPA